MRIRLTGTGSATLDGDYVITDLDTSVLHVVSATDLPGGAHGTLASGTFSGADGKGIIISQLQVKGVYTGADRLQRGGQHADPPRRHELARRRLPRGPADQDRRLRRARSRSS